VGAGGEEAVLSPRDLTPTITITGDAPVVAVSGGQEDWSLVILSRLGWRSPCPTGIPQRFALAVGD
jgi:hypothetical protein